MPLNHQTDPTQWKFSGVNTSQVFVYLWLFSGDLKWLFWWGCSVLHLFLWRALAWSSHTAITGTWVLGHLLLEPNLCAIKKHRDHALLPNHPKSLSLPSRGPRHCGAETRDLGCTLSRLLPWGCNKMVFVTTSQVIGHAAISWVA